MPLQRHRAQAAGRTGRRLIRRRGRVVASSLDWLVAKGAAQGRRSVGGCQGEASTLRLRNRRNMRIADSRLQ